MGASNEVSKGTANCHLCLGHHDLSAVFAHGACSFVAIGVPVLGCWQCRLLIHDAQRNWLLYLKEVIKSKAVFSTLDIHVITFMHSKKWIGKYIVCNYVSP